MLEEQSLDDYELQDLQLQIANCSHNFYNVNLCHFKSPDSNFEVSSWPEFLLCTLMYGLTMVFGIISNAIVLAVVLIRKANKRKNKLSAASSSKTSQCFLRKVVWTNAHATVADDTLMCLCTTDLIVIVVCIPIRLIRWFTYTWTFGEFLCKAVYYLQDWSAVSSVGTLSFLAVQRFYAAVHPLQVRNLWTANFVRLSLLCICACCALLTAPLLIGQKHRSIGTGSYFWCVTEFSSELQLQTFEVYMFILVVIAPLAAMISLYSFALCKMPYRHRINSDEVKLRQQKRYLKVLRLLILSVVVFAICWAPYHTDRLLSAIGTTRKFNLGWLRPFRMTTTLLAHANSCLNPFVYCFLSPHFRNAVRNLFRKPQTSNSVTRF